MFRKSVGSSGVEMFSVIVSGCVPGSLKSSGSDPLGFR
jgi:hypothetical protein